MIMVCLFFTVSLVNNYALNFNVPLPLHMIFRAVSSHPTITLVAKLLCIGFSNGKHATWCFDFEETVSDIINYWYLQW